MNDPGRLFAVAFAALAAVAQPAQAAELLMLEQPGCAWCARFRSEIAPAYANTPEGRLAPLRTVDITRPWPDDLSGIAPDRLTPTFILVEHGRERARMRGYPGDNFFWPLLDDMLRKLEPADIQRAR
ncbi:transcriptional regulator [Breoghania sp. JC706]|uniref:transcriptional regulator n=1 Tax=Breoghania sp. JC706 TaxID=3117732 RepID=UPI00300A0A26